MLKAKNKRSAHSVHGEVLSIISDLPLHSLPDEDSARVLSRNRLFSLSLLSDEIQNKLSRHNDPHTIDKMLQRLNSKQLLKGKHATRNILALLDHFDVKALNSLFGALHYAELLTPDKAQIRFNDALTHTDLMMATVSDFKQIIFEEDVNPDVVFDSIWTARKELILPPPLKRRQSPEEATAYFKEAFLAASLGDIGKLTLLSTKINLAKVINHENRTLVYAATYHGQLNVLILLHSLGVRANAVGNTGETAIYTASIRGNFAVLPILKRMGANVDRISNSGFCPVHLAVFNQKPTLLRILIEKLGANPNVQTLDGWTPGHLAAQEGSVDMLQLLHDLGANLNLPNQDGNTPVMTAVKCNHLHVIDKLASLGVNLNTQNFRGVTPLLAATLQRKTEMVATLLRHLKASHFTFFFEGNGLIDLFKKYTGEAPSKLFDMFLTKSDNFNQVVAFTLEEFVVALDDQPLLDLLTQFKPIDNEKDDAIVDAKHVNYQIASFFKPYDPDIATKLLKKANRYGNIEARHTSEAAQNEFDKVYGLVLRH